MKARRLVSEWFLNALNWSALALVVFTFVAFIWALRFEPHAKDRSPASLPSSDSHF